MQVNLSQLETQDQVILVGNAPVSELELDTMDELIRPGEVLQFDLAVELMEKEVLVRGELSTVFHCRCARCLEPFDVEVVLPEWTTLVPLQGEEKIKIEGDCIDLRPMIREDFLLSLPQRPLCENGCEADRPVFDSTDESGDGPKPSSGPWEALDDLKLK